MECKTKREKKKDAQLFFDQFRVQFVKNKTLITALPSSVRQSVSVSTGSLCLYQQAVCVCIIRQTVSVSSGSLCVLSAICLNLFDF